MVLCFLVTPCFGADITLEWDANKEPHLSGYKVYYKIGGSGPPYTGSGASEGNSPILVKAGDVTTGDACRFRLSGLSDTQTYRFVVRAIGRDGRKSSYSNEVSFINGGKK
jgi:hypothetical protein